MRQKPIVLATTLFALLAPMAAQAQQSSPPPRPAVLDAAAIRKQAAQMAEVRGLLSDPDPNVRLLAIREIAKSGDPIQKQLAIDTGLSSAEASMQQVALRAVVADTQMIFISLTNADGTPVTAGPASLSYGISKFDADTGKINGNGWAGQVEGAVMTIVATCCGIASGNLVWDAEAGEYRGTFNVGDGGITGVRKAVWRPR